MLTHQPTPVAKPLSQILGDIEQGRVKIPQFQRAFVWTRDQSARLLDSLLKGFPFGTFILWKTREELRSLRDIGGCQLPPTPKGDLVYYVLDGQQRLTSLFAALRGLPIKRRGRTENFRQIYVDLDAEPADAIVTTDISGRSSADYTTITDLQSKDFDELGIDARHRQKVRKYRDTITGYLCSLIDVHDASIDDATDIFTRINVTGKPLTVFEIMVAKTFDASKSFDLSEKVARFREELAECKFETVPDIVFLQTASVLLKKECKKQHILRLDKADFIQAWPKVEDAIRAAIDHCRSSLRIPVSALLPYMSLLVPLAYFFSKHHHPPGGEMSRRLEDLFWRVSLVGRYSSAQETKVGHDVTRVDRIVQGSSPHYDYPVNPTPAFIARNGEFRVGRSFVKAILCMLAGRKPRSFRNNAEVIISNDWLKRANSKNYHHFFPKSTFKSEANINHVANITIVDDYLNKRAIRAKKPSRYITDFARENPHMKETLETHLIRWDSSGSTAIDEDNFGRFFGERCADISKELRERIIARPSDEGEHAANSEDYEPLEMTVADAERAA